MPASLGFVAHQLPLDPSRQLRQLVTWVRRGLVALVTDLVPGNLQGVVLGEHRFLYEHAPSDSHPEDRVTCAVFSVRLPLYLWQIHATSLL
jgi:hypothetical protein